MVIDHIVVSTDVILRTEVQTQTRVNVRKEMYSNNSIIKANYFNGTFCYIVLSSRCDWINKVEGKSSIREQKHWTLTTAVKHVTYLDNFTDANTRWLQHDWTNKQSNEVIILQRGVKSLRMNTAVKDLFLSCEFISMLFSCSCVLLVFFYSPN